MNNRTLQFAQIYWINWKRQSYVDLLHNKVVSRLQRRRPDSDGVNDREIIDEGQIVVAR